MYYLYREHIVFIKTFYEKQLYNIKVCKVLYSFYNGSALLFAHVLVECETYLLITCCILSCDIVVYSVVKSAMDLPGKAFTIFSVYNQVCQKKTWIINI